MKVFLLFLISVFLGFGSYFFYVKFAASKPVSTIAAPTVQSKVQYSTDNAPSQTGKAKVVSFSGVVKWQSRTATDAAQINQTTTFQKGEDIQTEDNGKLNLEFPGEFAINLSSDSEISLAQTLPANLVILQNKGVVEYQKLGENTTSIRVLDLLIEQNSGDLTVSVSKTKPLVTITIKAGTATVAFEDLENVSQKITLNTGKQLIFNDDTRKVTIR